LQIETNVLTRNVNPVGKIAKKKNSPKELIRQELINLLIQHSKYSAILSKIHWEQSEGNDIIMNEINGIKLMHGYFLYRFL